MKRRSSKSVAVRSPEAGVMAVMPSDGCAVFEEKDGAEQEQEEGGEERREGFL